MALTKIKAAALTADLIDETKLADNSIDSEHYNDGSIDNAHLADDAVGVAELSATGTASSSTFLRGDNSWAAVPSGAALTGSTDNTICTVTGANAISGEANLTYDGTTLKNTVAAENGTIAQFELSGQTNNPALLIKADESDQQITFRAGSSTSTYPSIAFDMGTVGDSVVIQNNGNLTVSDGDLVIGTAGHGIDFSAQTATSATGSTTSGELFDHYEEGTWTPIFMYYSGGWYNCAFTTSPELTNAGVYTRIGRIVYFSYYSNTAFDMSTGASNTAGLAGLPYTAASDEYYVISVSHDNCWEQAAQNGYVSYGSDRMVFTRENDHPAATWSGSSGRYFMVSGFYHV